MKTQHIGPSPELALAVARMMCRIAGWRKRATGTWATWFSTQAGRWVYVAKAGEHDSRLFRPDLNYNQLWEVEEAITEEQRVEYTLQIRETTPIATPNVDWDNRHAPAWLCCVAALRAEEGKG